MNLLISLRSELLKTKRTASLYFTLVGAAVVPVVFLLNALIDELDATRDDPMNGIFKLGSEMNGMAFFPWFIILVSTLLPQIEYRNNTWKQVFTSPQTKLNVFLSKFLNIHLLILLFLVATHLFMFLAMCVVNLTDPTLNLFKHSFNGKVVLFNAANSYLAMLAVGAFQFWLGLRFKNFIIPVAVGLALWLTGTILVFQFNSDVANFFPHSFQIFPLMPKYKPEFPQVAWTSLGYAALFLLLGFIDFKRRRMSN